MDTKNANSLQEAFLDTLAKNKTRSIIFLTNGVRLYGTIIDFDSYCITMQWGDSFQLVYKNSISTVSPWNEKIHGVWKENNYKELVQNKQNMQQYPRR